MLTAVANDQYRCKLSRRQRDICTAFSPNYLKITINFNQIYKTCVYLFHSQSLTRTTANFQHFNYWLKRTENSLTITAPKLLTPTAPSTTSSSAISHFYKKTLLSKALKDLERQEMMCGQNWRVKRGGRRGRKGGHLKNMRKKGGWTKEEEEEEGKEKAKDESEAGQTLITGSTKKSIQSSKILSKQASSRYTPE